MQDHLTTNPTPSDSTDIEQPVELPEPETQTGSKRRSLLAGIGVIAAGITFAPALLGEKALPSAAAAITEKMRAGNVSFEWHLARRCSYTANETIVNSIKSMGWSKWLQAQIYTPESFKNDALNAILKEHFKLGYYRHNESNLPTMIDKFRFGPSASYTTVIHRMFNNQHVRERMTEFWMDLLSIHMDANGTSGTGNTYTIDIREKALGKFSDLLYYSTTSHTMNASLTNFTNRVGFLNENFGREILELHSVGVNGGYSETDVKSAASVLSGYIREGEGGIAFNSKRHIYGEVKVMGWKHSNTPDTAQPSLVQSLTNYLANHDKTAQRIAERLVLRFVREDIDSTEGKRLITALKTTYKANKTDIRPVLWQLFNSKEFADSVGMKFARPTEIISKTFGTYTRGWSKEGIELFNPTANSETTTPDLNTVGWFYSNMKHRPMGWIAPNGFPDNGSFWSSSTTMLQAQKLSYYVSRNVDVLFEYEKDWAKALNLNNTMTVDAIADRVYRYAHGFTPSGEIRSLLKKLIISYGYDDRGKLHPVTFSQKALNSLMAVVSGSPHIFVR